MLPSDGIMEPMLAKSENKILNCLAIFFSRESSPTTFRGAEGEPSLATFRGAEGDGRVTRNPMRKKTTPRPRFAEHQQFHRLKGVMDPKQIEPSLQQLGSISAYVFPTKNLEPHT